MRLTLPSIGYGTCQIRVDGRQVGHVLGRYWDWQAFLWPTPDVRPYPCDRTVERPRLRDLRAELRRRLDEDGPWWTEEDQ